jgi:hypothetical protein
MGLLRALDKEFAYAKVGLLGFAGAGKSYTAAEIAIGLHQHIGSKKPVAVLDTETGWDFLAPKFKAAGIDVLVAKSKTFKDLLAFMEEAQESCDIAVIDSISHVWMEIQEAYLSRINENRDRKITRLEFQHWGPIKMEWRKFTDKFLTCRMHVVICGRAGFIYDYEQLSEGEKKELVKTGVKMKAETEMAYEPSLLIEMERVQTRSDLQPMRKRGKDVRTVVNRAWVVKDRADVLDGKFFDDPTFDCFKPHFDCLAIGGEHKVQDVGESSSGLFDTEGRSDWQREKIEREKWSEEIQGILTSHFPGQSADEKKTKANILQEAFGTRSWTAITNTDSKIIREGFKKIQRGLEGEKEEAGGAIQ